MPSHSGQLVKASMKRGCKQGNRASQGYLDEEHTWPWNSKCKGPGVEMFMRSRELSDYLVDRSNLIN